MTNLRKEARGRECQIRLLGICNHNPETVVLCHIHKPSISGGTGLKADDVIATWGCSACHDECDGRSGYRSPQTIREDMMAFYEGCFRTQKILLDEGKIGVI